MAAAAAWDWYRKLTKGQVSSLGELAAQEEITQGTITRNLPLALLKPAQVDKLLKGNHHPDLTIKMLLSNPAILLQTVTPEEVLNSVRYVLTEIWPFKIASNCA